MRHLLSTQSGVSLVEALIASAVLASGILSLAQLVLLATNANVVARDATRATMLAGQKLEELRTLAWTVDRAGRPVTGTSLDAGPGLVPSPPASLQQNTVGYVEHLDAAGRRLGGGSAPPAGAVYTRRWSIVPMTADPDRTLIVEVRVAPAHAVAGRPPAAGVHLATVRTRSVQ